MYRKIIPFYIDRSMYQNFDAWKVFARHVSHQYVPKREQIEKIIMDYIVKPKKYTIFRLDDLRPIRFDQIE